MLRTYKLFLTLLFFPVIIFADTFISGHISTNTAWTKANSPYIVTDTVFIDSGATLDIQPGVEVRLDSARAIIINGKLLALGDSSDSIIITRNGTGRWSRLWFHPASECSLKYCRIEYAGKSAIYNKRTDSLYDSLYIGYCNISNNRSLYDNGGGINNSGAMILTNSTVSYNFAESAGGGGIYNEGLSSITGNTITHNTAEISYGGGICNYSWAEINNNTISYNTSGFASGGGIYTYWGYGAITDNTITYNSSYFDGGGIYTNSYYPITNNIISNNSAICGFGGGMYASGTITHNTISNNYALSGGGAISCSGFPTIRFNTITDTSVSAIFVNGSNKPFIRTNNIIATGYAIKTDSNDSSIIVDARYNWWGTTDTSVINSKIYDFYDWKYTGIVSYVPFLKQAFSDTTPPGAPINLTANYISDSTFEISWTNPADQSGISEYHYKLGAPPYMDFDTTGTFHSSPDTVKTGSQILYMYLIDSSGNFNTQDFDSVALVEIGTEENPKSQSTNPNLKIIKDKIYLFTSNDISTDIKIYDLCGRMKQEVYSGALSQGSYTFTPNIRSNGIYFVTLKTGTYQKTKKLILVKQ